MNIVFLGTSVFALPVLNAIFHHDYTVQAVVTQPDRPCGRGRKLRPSAVKVKAEELGIPIWQPLKVNDPDFLSLVREAAPDILVVAAYGQILRKNLLTIPPRGCLNVHASLLPAYRGAAPIRWALLSGEHTTGVTIMLMDEGVDTGPILKAREVEIDDNDNHETLTSRLGAAGSQLLIETLSCLEIGAIEPRGQNNEGVSYAPLLTRQMSQINWQKPAREIVNRIRALAPCPGAYGILLGKRIHILEASIGERITDREPGTVIEIEKERGISVASGDGVVLITRLKSESRKTLHFRDFCCGYHIEPGVGFSVDVDS